MRKLARELNKQIETERKRNIESAKSEYESLLDQQKVLEDRLKSFESEILVDGQALVKLQELQRDADANRNIYEQFLSRYKTTNEQRLLQTSQSKIASLAIPPIRSTRPPLALLLAGLALASLLTSSASVAMLEARKQVSETEVVASPAEPAPAKPKAPELPVWATIPRFASGESRKTVWQKPIASIGELDVSPYLATLLEKIGGASNGRGKVAVVTSVETGVGASTVAHSLNLSALNSGKISVLIQAEADNATSRREAQKNSGTKEHSSRTSLRSVNLLLSNRNGAQAGDDIRADFELIVIDAPPLHQQPDVASLAALADIVILVARDGATDRSAIEKARALLAKSGPAAVGLVINQAGPPRIVAAQSAMGLAS